VLETIPFTTPRSFLDPGAAAPVAPLAGLSIHTAPIVRRSLYWLILGPGLLSFSIALAVAYLFLVGMLSKRPFIVRLGDDNRHVAG
jgi:hypothetical protein